MLPILASLATDCDRAPRGAFPTRVARVELVLNSVPQAPPVDLEAFNECLNRMDGLQNHLRPSWRATESEPSGEVVLLMEDAPDVWRTVFFDVPVDFINTITVHDTNQCARDPAGQGHVTTGVTVNGTAITTVVGNDALVFAINPDGTVRPPPEMAAAAVREPVITGEKGEVT